MNCRRPSKWHSLEVCASSASARGGRVAPETLGTHLTLPLPTPGTGTQLCPRQPHRGHAGVDNWDALHPTLQGRSAAKKFLPGLVSSSQKNPPGIGEDSMLSAQPAPPPPAPERMGAPHGHADKPADQQDMSSLWFRDTSRHY